MLSPFRLTKHTILLHNNADLLSESASEFKCMNQTIIMDSHYAASGRNQAILLYYIVYITSIEILYVSKILI